MEKIVGVLGQTISTFAAVMVMGGVLLAQVSGASGNGAPRWPVWSRTGGSRTGAGRSRRGAAEIDHRPADIARLGASLQRDAPFGEVYTSGFRFLAGMTVSTM